ncbi:hypothetical protein BpHYR1_053855 [Brachionus plicatilis]|uniref:Uncharacterized protein n=1 Tax=Brachionus plicatilis TaxID=10195 RepID=A0A3M7Q5E9_BRAPC|nr:hypothetical protein BpHYR1_053855 [Brachionus plicatilis]
MAVSWIQANNQPIYFLYPSISQPNTYSSWNWQTSFNCSINNSVFKSDFASYYYSNFQSIHHIVPNRRYRRMSNYFIKIFQSSYLKILRFSRIFKSNKKKRIFNTFHRMKKFSEKEQSVIYKLSFIIKFYFSMCNVQGATIGDLLVGHLNKLVVLIYRIW